jgi:formylglycine-generating enzyme required for sulfatase activity
MSLLHPMHDYARTTPVPRVLPIMLAVFAVTVARAADVRTRGVPELLDSVAPVFGQNFTVGHPAIAMIWIAPGSFLMSSTQGAGDDTQVTLTHGYWLGQTEVTQSQWQALIERVPLPSYFKGSDRPVEQVSWELAMEYCVRLTERELRAGRLPDGYRYTLPTEAQWEYACRAGNSGIFAGKVEAMAWYDTNSETRTHPVAQKQPNAWALYDMHGNVAEWCADWYAGYKGGAISDPSGPESGQFRVVRGGHYSTSAGFCRSAYRMFGITTIATTVGFRLALTSQLNPATGGKTGGGYDVTGQEALRSTR